MKNYIFIVTTLVLFSSFLHAMNPSQQLINQTRSNNIVAVKEALNKGFDVNENIPYSGGNSTTLLHQADTPEMAQLLIDKGAKINARAYNGMTPLLAKILSAQENQLGIIETLLENGASLTEENTNQTPLQAAQQVLKDGKEFNNEETIEGAKVLIEIFENYPTLIQQGKTNPKEALKQAVKLGLVHLTQKILQTEPTSNQELQELAKIANEQYTKIKDNAYKKIVTLLQEKGRSLKFQLGLTGPELGISKTGALGYTGLPKDVISVIGK